MNILMILQNYTFFFFNFSKENKPSDIKQDIVYDRLVNNELNALIDIQKALENKMEDLKLNIIRKRIEKSEFLYFENFLIHYEFALFKEKVPMRKLEKDFGKMKV